MISLPDLPYAYDALSPYISEETLQYHHGKHHRAYVEKVNLLIKGTEFQSLALEDIIKKASGPIFNNAAQVWNHTFYWNCMHPDAGGMPQGALAEAINKDFGDFDTFKTQFTQAAATLFGSGWVWLVQQPTGNLSIVRMSNAGNPLTEDQKPLMTCDVWEHAYYIDTRNNRAQYLEHFWRLAHWDFVAENLSK